MFEGLTNTIKCNDAVYFKWDKLDKDERRIIKLHSTCHEVEGRGGFICKAHKERLGYLFSKHYSGKCNWSNSGETRNHKKKCFNPHTVTRAESFHLKDNFNIFLPMDSHVCQACYQNFMIPKLSDGVNETVIETPKTVVGLDLGNDSPMIDDHDISIGESDLDGDNDYKPDSQEIKTEKNSLLDKLIQLDGIILNNVTKKVLHQSYQSLKNRVRLNQIHNYVAAGIAAVLHSVSVNRCDDGVLLNGTLESGLIDKHLTTKPPPIELLREIIKSYNSAGMKPLNIILRICMYFLEIYKYFNTFLHRIKRWSLDGIQLISSQVQIQRFGEVQCNTENIYKTLSIIGRK